MVVKEHDELEKAKFYYDAVAKFDGSLSQKHPKESAIRSLYL